MNYVLCICIALLFALTVYWFFFRKTDTTLNAFETADENHFTEEFLREETIRLFDEILQTDYSILNLNKFETIKNERNQSKLRASLKSCSQGNISNKMYVKDYIKDLLQRRLGINEETITQVIPFHDPKQLTSQDKFEILLHIYKGKYDTAAMREFIEQNRLDDPIDTGAAAHYEITIHDIEEAYRRNIKAIENLDYYDYLAIIAQRIYQRAYGLGVIDEIRDMEIDGINCGTAGIPSTFYMYGADARFGAEEGELPLTSYNAIWLMFRGKLIHLSFIGFKTQRELERVCKLIYRYNNPGTLDEATGRIVNFMQDGSRVTVARPPFCESWCFFVRKFDAASKKTMEQLYPFENNWKLVQLLRWLVSGCRNIAITGPQFTGKSTLLTSMVQFIPASFSIRIQEMAFELHLRKLYPRRNITTFSETSTVSAQEGIDFSKKTDGTTSIFGEIAQAVVAALAIQMGQVGALQVMFTHHARTVHDLVEAFRDNMIEAAGYNNEKIVEKTVARVLNFDVHLDRTVSGKRYISRITEIMPRDAEDYPTKLDDATMQYYYRSTDRQIFESQDILIFKDDAYYFVGELSDWCKHEIDRHLSEEDRVQFQEFNAMLAEEVAKNNPKPEPKQEPKQEQEVWPRTITKSWSISSVEEQASSAVEIEDQALQPLSAEELAHLGEATYV